MRAPVESSGGTRGVAPLVLVVDDHADSRDMVVEYLAFLGYRVDAGSSGAEALEKVAALNPTLVVMDVRLPDGDGLDFVARIRRGPNLPKIVVYTAAMIGDSNSWLPAPFFPAGPVEW